MFIAVAVLPALRVRAGADDESAWAEYLDWLEGQTVGDLLGLESYRQELARQGLPEDEVARRIAFISERALRRPEAMRLWFNSMFGPGGAEGPDWPTPLLVEAVRDRKLGTALDVSDVALANAQAKARKVGVEMETVRSGYQDFDFGRARWDLIVMTYAYFPIHDSEYVDRLVESLRPGELLVFQYGVLPRGREQTGTAAWLGIPEEGELTTIFRDLRVLRYEEVEEISDWRTGGRERQSRTVKMLAEKP